MASRPANSNVCQLARCAQKADRTILARGLNGVATIPFMLPPNSYGSIKGIGVLTFDIII